MRLSPEGQVTVPKKFRDEFGLGPETEVEFVKEGNKLVLTKREARKPVDFTKLIGVADTDIGTDELMEMTRGDDSCPL